jgi:hypothetical protein
MEMKVIGRRSMQCVLLGIALLTLTQCRESKMETLSENPVHLTSQQLQKVASTSVFFGHQSVGDNIVQGLREHMTADPNLRLNLLESDTPPNAGPVFMEFHIGQNGSPGSKDEAFSLAMAKGGGFRGGVALYKYCYVDVTASTDVSTMFHNYRKSVESLKAKYPALTVVHVTVPLTTASDGWKYSIKSALGRTTEVELNAKRNQFNDLLREQYRNREPIFDLAEAESTLPDGSRSFVTFKGRRVYTLVPAFTEDGGHLNELGRRAVADKLLLTLAEL